MKGDIMSDFKFHASDEHREDAWVASMEEYKFLYQHSIENPESFWSEMAEGFYWEKKWDKVREYNYARSKGPINIEWFKGGKTNITYNCLDRHLETRRDQVAIIWEGNEPGEDLQLTYGELYHQVCKFANVLKANNITLHAAQLLSDPFNFLVIIRF